MRQCAPIVLVHGLLGFDRVKVGSLRVGRYFPGIEEALIADGFRIAVPSLSKTRGVITRAHELRSYLRENFPGEKVHLLAHSMAGLDSRYMLSRLGMEDRVRSLTTIATPHQGSSFADWGVRRLTRLVEPILNMLGISMQAFRDLTTEGSRRLMERCPDVPGISYHSVAGVCEPQYVRPRWRLSAHIVTASEGRNDGIVSVESARHGGSFELWNGDHMNLVNRPNRLTADWRGHPGDYLQLARRVAELDR